MSEYIVNKIEKEFGDLFPLLLDTGVTDIEYNEDGKVWIYRIGAETECRQDVLTPGQVRRLIGSIATYAGVSATEETPIISANLPWNNRFQANIEPITDSPTFSVRNHAISTYPLPQYIESGRIPAETADFLRREITKHSPSNIIVSGSTGSGKTTFTGALLNELSDLCPDDRLYIMEDTPELHVKSQNKNCVRTSKHVTMTMLLANALRYRPDRIIMGEVRDGAALDLLKSWNTGHPGGIVTLHANSARSALDRFEQLVLEAKDMPMSALRSLIGQAANIVVHLERQPRIGPMIVEVMKVEGLDNEKTYKTSYVYRHDP